MSEPSTDPTESNDSGTGDAAERSLRIFVPGLERPYDREVVTERLHRVPGVARVSTEPGSEILTVTYDADVTTEAAVTAAIRDAGYAVGGSPGQQTGGPRSRQRGCGCRGGPPWRRGRGPGRRGF